MFTLSVPEQKAPFPYEDRGTCVLACMFVRACTYVLARTFVYLYSPRGEGWMFSSITFFL